VDPGLADRAILDVAQVTAYFNFVNRLAQGLGVSLEGYWTQDETA
jgi:alkylhydroperoxidase family enzyme